MEVVEIDLVFRAQSFRPNRKYVYAEEICRENEVSKVVRLMCDNELPWEFYAYRRRVIEVENV